MEGVPRALLMPASRASAATRSKPTMRGQADRRVVVRPHQRVTRRHLTVILVLHSCAACIRTPSPRRRLSAASFSIVTGENSLVCPGSMVPSTAVEMPPHRQTA